MRKASPKRKRSEYRELVRDWIEQAKRNPDLLYLVKFTDRHSDSPIISAGKFLKSLGLPESGKKILYEECSSDLAEIYDLMHTEYFFIPNLTANQLNQINALKLLLRWFEKDPSLLNLVSVFGNSIQIKRLCNSFPELEINANVKSGGNAHHRPNDYLERFYKDTFEVRVLELLHEAGLHDPYSYTPVSQRANSQDQSENASSEIDSFIQASKSVGTLFEAEQISKQPFDGVYYLFAIGSRGRASRSAKGNFLNTYKTVVEFCKYKGFNGLEPVYELFSEYFAVRFRVYLEDKIAAQELSPSWANTVLSCLQIALDRLVEFGSHESFSYIRAPGFDSVGKSTDRYKPYEKLHREQIARVLDKDMQRVWDRHNTPYTKSENGQSFIRESKSGVYVVGELCNERNLRWFFDNCLGSKRITWKSIKNLAPDSNERLFFKALMQYRNRYPDGFKNFKDIYEAWGVPRGINRQELFAYYMRLIQVTGMNPVSALDLEIDSLELEHPATGKPCLRYWKERSDGSKEMHLDLFDAEIAWLTKSQASTVSELIEKVKALTESVREGLPEDHECRNLLFIAAGGGPQGFGKVMPLYRQNYEKERSVFEERYQEELLDTESGEYISLVATRFRASLVSEMVEADISIREIQLMMGHASIKTTLGYLERMDFNRQARVKIQDKLQQIYENSWVPKEPESIPAHEKSQGEIIFKTPLGGCANIFDPPDFIKNSSDYDGGACSNFNKCLSCPNVIITKTHLPDLFALLRDYRSAWQHGSVAATPYGVVVRENIEILESLLGEESEFDQEELEEAERRSRYIDSTVKIDGVAV